MTVSGSGIGAAVIPGAGSGIGAAVITGAGTGIGAAVARRLAAGGTPVVLTGRRPQPLRDVAADLGDAALVVPGDAGSAADMTRVVQAAIARFGGIGVLVANAGGAGAGTAAGVDDAAWAQALHVNLTTCLVAARACLPELIRSKGAIVVVSSIAGLAASPESVGYVTAKHGMIGLARSMARDFGPQGVRVNTVCPGWVRTPMGEIDMRKLNEDVDEAYRMVTRFAPLRRAAEPDEVASVICFLASDDASYMTGAVVMVDGGSTAVDVLVVDYDEE